MKLKLVRVRNDLSVHSGVFGEHLLRDYKGRVIDDPLPGEAFGEQGYILRYMPGDEYFVIDYWAYPDEHWEILWCRNRNEASMSGVLRKRHCEEIKGFKAWFTCLVESLKPSVRRMMKMSSGELDRRRSDFLKKLAARDKLFAEQMAQLGAEV